MGFFNKYPYTDEHELNLDWIIAKINALKDRVKGVEDAIHDIVVETPKDGRLTIKRNNTAIGDFTANQATDEDINISVPENTSDLINDSGFITLSDIPAQVQSNWNEADNTSPAYIQNKPTIPAAQVNSDWNAVSGVEQILNKPTLATVATSGNYNDLSNKPTIPAAQVNSDWNAVSGVEEILNKPTLATVATSGNYNDLSNKPTIPTTTSYTLTPGTNVTINLAACVKLNNIIFVTLKLTTSAALSTNAILVTGLPSSGYNVYMNCGNGYNSNAYGCRTGADKLYTNQAIPASTELNITSAYIQ